MNSASGATIHLSACTHLKCLQKPWADLLIYAARKQFMYFPFNLAWFILRWVHKIERGETKKRWRSSLLCCWCLRRSCVIYWRLPPNSPTSKVKLGCLTVNMTVIPLWNMKQTSMKDTKIQSTFHLKLVDLQFVWTHGSKQQKQEVSVRRAKIVFYADSEQTASDCHLWTAARLTSLPAFTLYWLLAATINLSFVGISARCKMTALTLSSHLILSRSPEAVSVVMNHFIFCSSREGENEQLAISRQMFNALFCFLFLLSHRLQTVNLKIAFDYFFLPAQILLVTLSLSPYTRAANAHCQK